MKKHLSYWRVSLFVLSFFVLSGCVVKQQQLHAVQQPSASISRAAVCSQNKLLRKYNCSIAKVEEAAERGDPDAQYALGYMYYYGIGTVVDSEAATLWIHRAAVQGQPLAIKASNMLKHREYPAMADAK